MRLKLTLAALAAATAFATPAAAQVVTATAQAEARGTVLLPLTLSKIDDLDFGTILASPVAGSVTIDADTGNRSVTGGVAEVGVNGGQRALFTGAGPAGDQVNLVLTPPAGMLLYRDPTTTLTVTSIDLDQGGATNRTMDGVGAFAVGVGGTFAIGANQAPGLYAADFDLTAEYQ
jgi:opacity protein-like surface antigen